MWLISEWKTSNSNEKSDENEVKPLKKKQLIHLKQVFEVFSIDIQMYKSWAICTSG